MVRWLRRLVRLVLALALLPVLALAGGLVWANTGSGRATLARLAAAQVPGLAIDGLGGALPWRVAVARLALADAGGDWVVIEDAELRLDLTALLRRTVRVEALTAATVMLARLPAASHAPAAAPAESVLPTLPRLPVAVALDRLAVGRLALGVPVVGQAAAFAVEGSAGLAAGALDAGLALRRLDAAGAVDLRLALHPGGDRLAATLRAEEAPDGLLATLAGLPGRPLTLALTLDGPASGAALDLRASLGEGIAATATGTVRAGADGGVGAALRARVAAAPLLPPEAAALASPAEATLDAALGADRVLALRGLDLAVPAGRLTAEGQVALATEALALRLRLDAAGSRAFGALLPAGLAWRGIAATASVGGTLARPILDLTARPDGLATGQAPADAVLGPAPTLRLRASLPGPAIDLALDGAEGRLAAAGSLGDPLALDARLDLPRLAVLGGGSTGALALRVRATGPRADPDVAITAESGRIVLAGRVLEALSLDARLARPRTAPQGEARLAGRLDGLALDLAARARPEGDAVRIEQAEAQLGPARLTLAGRFDPAGRLFIGTARLEATDLAPLGRLAGQAGLGGRLTLDGRFTPRPEGVQGVEVTLDAPRLAFGATEGRLEAKAAGTPSALDWSVAGSGAGARLAGRGRLGREAGGWRLDLAALDAAAEGETLRLAAPTRVGIDAAGGIALAPATLALGGGGRIEARGQWGPERAEATASLAGLPLALAGRFVPEVQPRGILSGELRATGPVAAPQIRAILTGTGLGAGAAWARGLPPATLRAEATLQGQGATASGLLRADLGAGAAGRLIATVRLPGGFAATAPVAATLDGGIDLRPIAGPFLAAGADRVAGRLQVALRVEGTVGAPRPAGRITLAGGEVRNAAIGLALTSIAGSLAADGRRVVVERLEARTAGNGRIALSGNVDTAAPGMPADLTVAARDARPVASDLGTATIGADLRLRGPVTAGATLAGEVRIARAELRIPEQLPASVPRLDDVRQIGRLPPGVLPPPPPAPPALPAPPLNLDLAIAAPGGGVFLRGRGIDVELGGTVRIGGTAAAPVPSGGLTLRRGTVDVLGRQLAFTRGSFGFTAGTLVPQIDLAAQANAGTTTIRIEVTGTPVAPAIAFTSTPELPQDEVLARLLFNRGTGSLSPIEIAQIAGVIAQLSGVGGGGPGPVDRVRTLLGLDRLGVGSGDAGADTADNRQGGQRGPVVEAGRYVAPGVYLGVRQGTQGGQTGVGVQVEITPRLKLEGQTATGPAGDRVGVTYEFEY